MFRNEGVTDSVAENSNTEAEDLVLPPDTWLESHSIVGHMNT